MSSEKRTLKRYLCRDNFSDTEVQINSEMHTFLSINFNHTGLAVSSFERLPESKSCIISFTYQTEQRLIVVDNITCEVRYRFETEVGHQYGLMFLNENGNYRQFKAQLMEIETDMDKNESAGRYF